MFKNMFHTYKIVKNPESSGFILDVFICRNTVLKKCQMTLYTNHLLNVFQYPTEFNKHDWSERKSTSLINHFDNRRSNVDKPIILCQQPYAPEIHFAQGTSFATYKYFFPNVRLALENRLVIVGVTDFQKVNVVFNSIYDVKKTYQFTMQEELLEE